jgi:hypothetical protein
MSSDQIAAVEEFAARIKTYYTKLGGDIPSSMVAYYVDLLVKEYKKQEVKDGETH